MKHNLTRAQKMQMKHHSRRVVDNQIDAFCYNMVCKYVYNYGKPEGKIEGRQTQSSNIIELPL